MTKAVITVLGEDKVGIVAGVAKVLAEHACNIEDISQTIMGKIFSMIMLVSVDDDRVDFDELRQILDKTGAEIGVKIILQQEDVFKYMHRI